MTAAMDRRAFLSAAGVAWLTGPTRAWSGVAEAVTSSVDYAKFERQFGGTVFKPASPDYARLTKVYQARSQARPALFAHCTSSDDVRRAVSAAREAGSTIAVRCGGHSYAGHCLGDGGVVLDLSGLKTVAVSSDGASVTVGGGVLAGMIDQATAATGRAMTLGQCPTVGIGGLALGGGVGPLMARQGLTCDNLMSAEIVLADGRIVVASPEEDDDLYWAIRGGGGNFGVATSLTFRLHQVGEVLGGFVTLRSPDPRDMLRLYADLCAKAPSELMLLSMMTPDREGRPTLSIQVCHCGQPEQAAKDVAALMASPYVIEDGVRRLRYAELQTQGPPEVPVMPTINRAGFRRRLDDAAVNALGKAAANAPGPYMIGVVPMHGAVTAVAEAATAFPMRRKGMAFGLTSILTGLGSVAPTQAWITSLGRGLAEQGAGAYVNVMDDEGPDAVRSAYGRNYARLAKLKARYDPENVFRYNQNIRPSG